RHDAHDGAGHNATVCATLPESRKARDRPDRQHPVLSRRATWACAENGSSKAVGAPTAAPHHRSPAGTSRYPSAAGAKPLLRGPARAGKEAHRGVLEGAGAEISRLFRTDTAKQRRQPCHRPQAHLRRSVAVSDRGGAALCFSKADEAV